MRMVRGVAAATCGLVFLFSAGCGAGPKDLQIQELQAEVNRLNAEKQALLKQLQDAINDRDAARARVAELERQLAGMQPTPAGPPGWELRGPLAWINISEGILFDSGKADLKPGGRAELQRVLNQAREYFPTREVWVVGHTDTDPIKYSKWKDNLELSVQRAATVFREMHKLGVDPQKMVAAGRGEFTPIAPNTTREGKRLNRRVQVIAIEVPSMTGPAIEEAGERG